MDRGTVVGFQTGAIEPIRVEQAIFTSIRSPMGEGYRIVSASAGVKPEERAEITRCSPSHGSLCSDEPSAEAIASYPLPGGRHCVAHSRYAGTEHTARGGLRVWTHAVIVRAQDYVHLGCNPLRVWDAVPQMVEAEGLDRIPPQLPVVTLEPDPHQVLSAGGLVGLAPEIVCAISSELMNGQRLVLRGAKRAFAGLEWTLMLMPAAMRARVSLTAGIKVSPSRPVQMAWVEPDQGETARALMGQNIRLLDLQKEAPKIEPSPKEWFTLLNRWWRERRWDEICLLTNKLSGRIAAADLGRIATICQAIDDASVADGSRLQQYRLVWQRLRAGTDAERELVGRLGQVIEARSQALDRAGLSAKTGPGKDRDAVPPRAAKVLA